MLVVKLFLPSGYSWQFRQILQLLKAHLTGLVSNCHSVAETKKETQSMHLQGPKDSNELAKASLQ